jgi:hypothetical protein
MNNKLNNPWGEPNADKFNFDEHARNQDANDPFGNRLVDNVPGSLERNLLQLAATSDEAQDVLRENGIELPTVAKQFRMSHGEIGTIVADAKGLWRATIVVDGQTLTFQSEQRDSAMMGAERYLETNRGPRELTETEKLRVARIAQSGDSAEAASLYVALRLDRMAPRSAEAVLTDPTLTWLLNEAAVTIWRYTRPDYVFDQAFEEIVARAAEMKPLSVNNVDFLFDRFQESQRGGAIPRSIQAASPENEVVPSQAEVQNELENLNDVELSQIRMKTLRHRAELVRRFDEQIGRQT